MSDNNAANGTNADDFAAYLCGYARGMASLYRSGAQASLIRRTMEKDGISLGMLWRARVAATNLSCLRDAWAATQISSAK